MTPADIHLPVEERLFRAVNVDAGPAVDAAARLLSSPAFGAAVAVTLAAALAARRRDARWAWVLALAAALALSDGLGSQLVRPLLPRARPVYALPAGTVRNVAPAANVGSIPSLHAANFFAMALVGSAGWPALAPFLYAIATMVAWSRMYVGVHWPGDVLLGAAWGTLWGWAAVAALRAALRRRAARSGQ
ncbi:MAG TPA: phosphatase PAP2 family protein [Anaeromyxobacteraceae bacterium]|nr:phosphatase PAP2 family protein [Anaeromyxobacteraceae bacterium]